MNVGGITQTRSILVRLSVATAFASAAGLVVYFAGNLGSLSYMALSLASNAAGLAGFAAIILSISGLLANVAARTQGAGFSIASLPPTILSGIVGSAGMIVAGIVRATGGGLSF